MHLTRKEIKSALRCLNKLPNASEFIRMEEIENVPEICHPSSNHPVVDELRAEISELKKRVKVLEEWRERNTDDGR